MRAKKLIAYGIGAVCGTGFLFGVFALIFDSSGVIASAVILICLSVCFGILLPNPISVAGFIAGICMLLFPAPVVGALLLFLSVGGAVANFLVFRKKLAVN